MKIRYHRHTLRTLIDNSIKEGLDALIDNNFELYNYIAASDIFFFIPKLVDDKSPDPEIDGCKFYGWVHGVNGQHDNWVRLYNLTAHE
jgi:hypothetical protein